MFCICVIPVEGEAPDRVRIVRVDGKVKLDLAGRPSAVQWLTNQGCCPGAAAMLYDAIPWQPYTIAEPLDPPADPVVPLAVI